MQEILVLIGQTPTPAEARELGELMRDLGGWGVSVVFAVAIAFLWRRIGEKDERIFFLLDKQTAIFDKLEKINENRNK